MGYRTLYKWQTVLGFEMRVNVGYKAPPLKKFVLGVYKAKVKPCKVCGAADRATKATGCDYLAEAA